MNGLLLARKVVPLRPRPSRKEAASPCFVDTSIHPLLPATAFNVVLPSPSLPIHLNSALASDKTRQDGAHGVRWQGERDLGECKATSNCRRPMPPPGGQGGSKCSTYLYQHLGGCPDGSPFSLKQSKNKKMKEKFKIKIRLRLKWLPVRFRFPVSLLLPSLSASSIEYRNKDENKKGSEVARKKEN